MGTLSAPFLSHVEAIAISLLGKPSSHSPSALRWGRRGSLVLNLAGSRAGRFHDFETRQSGDVIDLVQRETGLSQAKALEWLRSFTGRSGLAKHIAPAPQHLPVVWSEKARAIWRSTEPLRGTLGETYLKSRNCYVPNVSDLRFSNGGGKYPPSLVARVTDFVSGKPMTLAFIRLHPIAGLKASGNDSKRFLSGYRKNGGVVRLAPAVPVDGELGVAEGIETALSVMAARHVPVYAALDAGNLGGLPTSDRYGRLVIWADNDPAGSKAASSLAARWQAARIPARIELPLDPGSDWNDVVMADAQEVRK